MKVTLPKIKTALTLSTAVTLLGITAHSAQAGILFTYEAPGVQTTQVSNTTTEFFNSAPVQGNFTGFNSTAIGGTGIGDWELGIGDGELILTALCGHPQAPTLKVGERMT